MLLFSVKRTSIKCPEKKIRERSIVPIHSHRAILFARFAKLPTPVIIPYNYNRYAYKPENDEYFSLITRPLIGLGWIIQYAGSLRTERNHRSKGQRHFTEIPFGTNTTGQTVTVFFFNYRSHSCPSME